MTNSNNHRVGGIRRLSCWSCPQYSYEKKWASRGCGHLLLFFVFLLAVFPHICSLAVLSSWTLYSTFIVTNFAYLPQDGNSELPKLMSLPSQCQSFHGITWPKDHPQSTQWNFSTREDLFLQKIFKLSFPFKKGDDKKHTHEPLFVKCLQMMKRNAYQYPHT